MSDTSENEIKSCEDSLKVQNNHFDRRKSRKYKNKENKKYPYKKTRKTIFESPLQQTDKI